MSTPHCEKHSQTQTFLQHLSNTIYSGEVSFEFHKGSFSGSYA